MHDISMQFFIVEAFLNKLQSLDKLVLFEILWFIILINFTRKQLNYSLNKYVIKEQPKLLFYVNSLVFKRIKNWKLIYSQIRKLQIYQLLVHISQ